MAAGRPRPTWDARKVQVFVDATIALLLWHMRCANGWKGLSAGERCLIEGGMGGGCGMGEYWG